MRWLQFIIGLFILLLSFEGNIWASLHVDYGVGSAATTGLTKSSATIPFQEYENCPLLGTICDQLNEQVDNHDYKMLHFDSHENNYCFNVGGERLLIDNIVTYSRYPVNPINGMDNFKKYLRFLSHSLYLGSQTVKRNFEFELIRTYPPDLYDRLYEITDDDFSSDKRYSSVSVYVCKLNNIMKDSHATLALYLDHDNRLIGYDFLGSEELQRKVSSKNNYKNKKIKKDWGPKGWQNYIYLPIDIGICVKQTVGEVIKSPIDLMGVPIVRLIMGDIEVSDKPLSKIGYALKLGKETFKEDIREIRYIWLYRLGKLNHHHKLRNLPLNFICEPIREIPLIGNYIPRNTNYVPTGTQTPGYLFLSRGIYGCSAEEQDTKNWEQFMKNILLEDINTKKEAANGENNTKPAQDEGKTNQITAKKSKIDGSKELQVCSIPYKYGSIMDVIWSLFNISSGYGYEMAYRIVNEHDIGQGDVIFLTGHSGGVQRCLIVEKLLLENQIRTQRRVGVAGPSQGIVYWSKSKDSQNYITFLNQNKDYGDIVSNLSNVVDILPPMCVSNWIWKKNEEKIRVADITLRHITPGVIDSKTRIPACGYLGKEYIDFFSNSYVGEQLIEPTIKQPSTEKKIWWRQMPLSH